MEKYRRPDSYYIDSYDRRTIAELKELERLMNEAEKLSKIGANDPHSEELSTEYMDHQIRYSDAGARFASNKQQIIQTSIQSDERKDRLIQSNSIPAGVRCTTCSGLMKFELHGFIGRDENLVFFFSCINGHLPKKAVYPDGSVHHFAIRVCQHCGGKFTSKKSSTKDKLTFTDTCENCGEVEILELDTSPEEILPVNEADRKKYCTDFIGSRTSSNFLKDIYSLAEFFDKQEDKIKYNYDQVKQLNIAQLEQTLRAEIEKSGFIKVQFDKPKTGRYLTLAFSAQDPTAREEAKSIKTLKKTTETTLFTTNWRLASTGISYKLGFLDGRLIGYSLEEDLIKIAKEIEAKKAKQANL